MNKLFTERSKTVIKHEKGAVIRSFQPVDKVPIVSAKALAMGS